MQISCILYGYTKMLLGVEKMKKVLVMCESGISSHFLVKAAQPFIKLYGADIQMIATDINSAKDFLDQNIQLVLVAPQASYREKELQMFGNKVQVKTIPDDIYGWGNGEKLVKLVMNQLSPVEVG